MNAAPPTLEATMVGCGAIGHGILAELADDPQVRISQMLVLPAERAALRDEFPTLHVATGLDELASRPALLIECAGHAAVVGQVLPALARGIDCIVCSVGALAQPGLVEQLEQAAHRGAAQVQLVSGAIGGIDALAAARVGGLQRVVYTGRKPPHGWRGTPAEEHYDLDAMDQAGEFFTGSARDAARQFPKNANVAATVSLAGLGLDDTEVHLIADPNVQRNVHHVHAEGAFGEFEIRMAGHTLPSNPKTSALTVYSGVRALRNRARPVAI